MTKNEELDNVYRHHAPRGDQQMRYETIRNGGRTLARCIIDRTPESREQSLALERLEEAIMWAIEAIARNE